MNQYINNNFNLCLSTQIFMLFDLYIIRYDDNKSNQFISLLWNKFLNNEINLTEFIESNNVSIFNQVISNLSEVIDISSYDLNYKPINNIKINTNDIYKQIEPSSTETMLALQIKKFDDINYIVPVMLSMDYSYLESIDRNIQLDNFFEYLNNTKDQDKLLTNFSNIVNI